MSEPWTPEMYPAVAPDAKFRQDLQRALEQTHRQQAAQRKLGTQGKGVNTVAQQFRDAGVRDVTVRLYPGARHELFNETNRDEITAELIDWLNRHMK